MKYYMRWLRGPKCLSSRLGTPLAILAVLIACLVFPISCKGIEASYVAVEDNGDRPESSIYVPYQDLVQLIDPADKAMLMDRAKFEKLLAAAEASAEGADSLELGQVMQAEYSGTVSGEELTLAGKLKVVSMGEGPVVVPLGFARIGLTQIVLDGGAAPLGYDKKGRLTLIVDGKGEHEVEIAGTAKLEELSGGGMQFSISLPAAVAGSMKLTAPGDLEMHATVPVSKPVYDKETDRTGVELTIGGQGTLTVVLLGNGRQEDDRAILLAESAATLNLTRSHQVMSCLYTVQVLRRGVRELRFRLPSQWTVTEVTCPSLVRWSVAAIEDEAGQGSKMLAVRLRSAKVGTVALHIKAAAFRSGQKWQGPRVILVDAAFERGYLMVDTDEGLRVRTERLTGARREDVVRASVPGIIGSAAGRLYFHWGDKWSVDLELATVPPRRSVKEQQRLVVSQEQVELTGNFEVTAIDRELFDMSFVLAGKVRQWHIRTVQVDGRREGFEYRVEEEDDRRLLRIELARPVAPEKVANVIIVLQHVPSDWHWPSDAAQRNITVPLIESEAETVSGHVSISAVGDLDALPVSVPEELEAVPIGRMASLEMPAEVQYAYKYKGAAKGKIALEVSRRRPRLAAEAVGLITVRPQGVTGDWRITYTISRASAKRLHLLADKSLAEKIKITSGAVRISSKSIVSTDDSLSGELSQRYNLWLLNLDQACFGEVPIEVHYERPLPEDGGAVPLVRPICEGGQINEQLAVQASEELALTITAGGVKEIDAVDLPPLPVSASRVLAAYRLEAATTTAGSKAEVKLETAVHENYRVPSALAVSGWLTTYVDVQGGQRTEATFHIANAGRQFLTIRLPKDAQLWSLRVGDRQAKPQRSAQGDYQVAVGRSRRPVPVRIVYAYRLAEVDLEGLELGGVDLPGVEMNQMHWNVIPPPGYEITTQQTKMQTRNLARPIPACVQAYDFLADSLFWGLGLMRVAEKCVMSMPAGHMAWSSLGEADESAAFAVDQTVEAYGEELKAEPSTIATYGMVSGKTPAPQRAVTFTTRTVREGRFTLPVDLAPTPGAGPSAGFRGLGATDLIVGLASQSGQRSWGMLGFALIVVIAVASAFQEGRTKATLFVVILSVSSLLAIWWPGTTHFANGAFVGGVCLLPFYLLVTLVRWLWPKLRFGAPVGAKAVAGTGFVFLVLLLGSSAQVAQAEKTVPSRRVVRPEDDKAELPPLIIPYEGDPTAAEESEKVLIPYARFVKLWNRAHPEDPIDGLRPGTDISLAAVRYRVTVEEEQLRLVLTAELETYGKDWVVLALPMRGLAVTEATIDGKPAQLQGVPRTENGASRKRQAGSESMVLMLPGGRSGRLQLRAVAKPKYFGRRGSAGFSLPPLPGAVMTVVLPAEDLELEVDEIEGTLTRRTVNGTVEWTVPLGMTRQLALRWLPKVGDGAADRTLSATSEHDVYAFHWAMVGVSKIRYSFSAGEHDRFALYLPATVTVTDLKGANVRDFREIGEKTIEDRLFKIIEVRLHRPAKERYELTVRWLGGLSRLDKPSRLFLVRAGDVSRESGTVTLHAAGGMTVKVAEVTGGRRRDISVRREVRDAGLTANRTQPVARYYWPYRPFGLFVQLSRPTVSPKAKLDQLIRLGTDRVQLLVQAHLKVERGRLFGADFALPAGYELLSVVGPVVENFDERSSANGRLLHVKFSSAERETTMALVLVRNDVELGNFQVPTIVSVDSQGHPLPEQEGRVAVQVVASLEAQTVSSENLKSVAPRLLHNWLDESQIDGVQFAYRYEVPDPSLVLNIRRQPTEIRVESFAGLVVKATAAAYTYRLRYEITGSPIDHLCFQMPSEYARLVAVESPAMRSVTQSEAEDGRTSWDVALANEVTGTVDVTVNFSIPIDASTKVLEVPRIETAAPAGYRAITAVQNISRHEISVREKTNLDELAVSEQRKLIPSPVRQSLQYTFQSFKDNWSLSLDFAPAKPAARIQAVVDLLALTTVIDRSGRCRYEAKVALQNRSEQFLKVKVPEGLRMWSATVAGQPVKPVTATDSSQGEVLVPLVKTSPGGLPYDVYLYFADEGTEPLVAPLNGITRLSPPGISIVGMPVMQTVWSLRLPGGYRYMRPGGNMSSVAGTVETLSLGIGARLEQLKRLDKAYREIAGSSREREGIAKQNWDYFNQKVATEIKAAQQYLESNRDEVAGEDYKRLRSKLSKQVTVQDSIITDNTAAVRRQQEQADNNMNLFLNATITNAGVAEMIRNGRLLEKPRFVGDNELRQIERLNRELQVTEQQERTLAGHADILLTGDTLRAGDSAVIDAGGEAAAELIIKDHDKGVEMGKILKELSQESAAQIQKKQAEIRGQLSELRDNRAQRLFASSLEPPKPESAAEFEEGAKTKKRVGEEGYGLGYRGGRAGREWQQERPGRTTGRDRGRPELDSGAGIRADNGDVVLALPGGTMDIGGLGVAGPGVDAYVAKGTYSLPVTLPEGEVRLDFARPSGEAELSVWAVPASLLRNTCGSLAVLGILAVVMGGIKVWPRPAKRRPISVTRVVLYVLLFVVLTVVLGPAGLLVGLAIILAIEARRQCLACRVEAAGKNSGPKANA